MSSSPSATSNQTSLTANLLHSSINQRTHGDHASAQMINTATKHHRAGLCMVANAPLSSVHLSKLPPNLRLAPVAADASATWVTTLRDPGNEQGRRLAPLFPRLLLAPGAGWRWEDARTPGRNKMGGRGLSETPWAEPLASGVRLQQVS